MKPPYVRERLALPAGPVHTERLSLRPFAARDVTTIMAMDTDPEVMRYIPGHLVLPDAVEAHVQAFLADLETGDRYKFFYAIDWKDSPAADDDALGWVLLRPTEDGRWIELGYRLRRAAWGAGVATEASKAMLDIAFDQWGVAQVMAAILPGNARSRRVVEKLGFAYRGIDRFYDEDCWLFVLDGDGNG